MRVKQPSEASQATVIGIKWNSFQGIMIKLQNHSLLYSTSTIPCFCDGGILLVPAEAELSSVMAINAKMPFWQTTLAERLSSILA